MNTMRWTTSTAAVVLVLSGSLFGQQPVAPDIAVGTHNLLRIATNQNSLVRVQSATQIGPSSLRLTIRNDSPVPIQTLSVAIVQTGPGVAPGNAATILKRYSPALTAPVDAGVFDVTAELASLNELAANRGARSELGIADVAFIDGTRWTSVILANQNFERLPAGSPLRPPKPPIDFAVGVRRSGGGCQSPVPTSTASPKYTSDAMRAKLQGNVELDVVVLSTGAVGPVKVVSSLDSSLGLDEQAIAAARGWRFTPASCQGTPVDMVVQLVVEFRLH